MDNFLWVAASAGALSLIAPCVLPAIPLTAGYFARRRATSASASGVEAILFAVGIVSTFSGGGLALSLLVGAAGINRLAANPWMNLFVASVFIASAASLAGAFTIRLPARLANPAGRDTHAAPRVVGPLLMGATFTLATFACTAPFVGPLLVAASTGEWTRPFWGMFVYSTVFAVPFVVLALMPRAIERVPRAGRWTVDFRIVLAAVQLGVALKFLSTATSAWGMAILTRETIIAAWIVLALSLAAFIALRGAPARSIRGRLPRFAAAAVPFAIAAWFVAGVRGQSLGELEALLPAPAGAAEDERWIVNDYDAAIAVARSERRPLFVDFTGYSCGNCRWMEANMFASAEVKRALRSFVLVRLYTDGDGPLFERHQRMQENTFGTVALPLYAVLDPDGRPQSTFVGVTRDRAAFVRFLTAGTAVQ